MKIEPEQDDFLRLRRLLAVKRHEQPPPGYFDHFSREVIVRLRDGEGTARSSLVEAFSLQRLFALLQNRPILAGGFGFAACSLLVAGLLFSEPNTAGPWATTATAVAPQLYTPVLYGASTAAEPMSDVVVPPGQLSGSLFQQLKQLPGRPQLLASPAPSRAFP